jgi:hypothetical protein
MIVGLISASSKPHSHCSSLIQKFVLIVSSVQIGCILLLMMMRNIFQDCFLVGIISF